MARLSTVSSFFLSQIGVREFLPDININSNILTEESVVNILQSIIVKNVKKLCLSRRTLTKQKQFSETTTATCVDLISKCTTLVDLDLEGCFYLSPSQDQCRNKKIYCNEPQGSNKTYMYMYM